jgi:hypothetical protein
MLEVRGWKLEVGELQTKNLSNIPLLAGGVPKRRGGRCFENSPLIPKLAFGCVREAPPLEEQHYTNQSCILIKPTSSNILLFSMLT